MRVLLLAAGSQARWADNGGPGRKQEVVLRGERVIDRAYRLATERGGDVVTLVRDPQDPTWEGLNAHQTAYEDWMGEMGKWLDGRPYWPAQGDVVLLLGDVFYTAATMDLIFQSGPVAEVTIYGRPYVPVRRMECFAARFNPERDGQHVERVAREAADASLNISAGMWNWFFWANGGRGKYHWKRAHQMAEKSSGFVTVPEDETDDFDEPAYLRSWRERFEEVRS